jgi:hypothetical protein
MHLFTMKKRITSVLIGLTVAFAMVFSACDSVTNDNGGPAELSELLALSVSGAKVGQTVITDQDGLAAIERDPSGNYELGASFAVTNWIPICGPYTGTDPFTGALDGKGYTITINSFDPTALGSNIGIFQTTQGATIINLTVDGSLDVTTTATGATPVNIGLVAGSASAGTRFGNITINGDLKVLYNGPALGVVNAGGIAGYLSNCALSTAFIDGLFALIADMPYTYSLDNGVRLGGAAGYADNNASFYEITVDASTAVNADTTNNPVYVGGVLGKGLTVTITGNTSYAVVTGNGPGYNTSAGGIAGYIQQSTVATSSAFGEVTLGAAWESGSYDYWQVYAGGLVGYSGGTDSGTSGGGSVIDHSHACGAVSANAPYPYAGGLVGYNYGYNDFSGTPAEYAKFVAAGGVTVTYNGSKITESYATGNVQATATANGLPYAGGLAGYSSIPTVDTNARAPNIENCYAKGNVIATSGGKYAWAGGLIGANAQGSIVSKTYAIGTVDVKVGTNDLPYSQPGINPGAAGGGIAGVNYYVDATSTLQPRVEFSVGLNALIYGTSADTSVAPYLLQRVVGDLGQNDPLYLGKLDDNYGNNAMSILPTWNQDIRLDGLDGDSATAQPAQSFYSSTPLNWNFSSIWTMDPTGYPALQ